MRDQKKAGDDVEAGFKVVGLNGLPVAPELDDEAIDVLEAVLRMARAGQVQGGVAVVVLMPDGHTHWNYTTSDFPRLIGAIECMKARVLDRFLFSPPLEDDE